MKIAVTGHRPNKLGNEYSMDGPVSKRITSSLTDFVLSQKPEMLISGMALGVDLLFAKVAIEHRIPFTAAVPFIGQELRWPQCSRDRYAQILSLASEVVVVCPGGYSAFKMQKRNEWMVDHCDLLIAVWDGTSGGTANCVQYAQSTSKEIFRINPNHWR
jgi:uncharacterized phage-like protein YoqJ